MTARPHPLLAGSKRETNNQSLCGLMVSTTVRFQVPLGCTVCQLAAGPSCETGVDREQPSMDTSRLSQGNLVNPRCYHCLIVCYLPQVLDVGGLH